MYQDVLMVMAKQRWDSPRIRIFLAILYLLWFLSEWFVDGFAAQGNSCQGNCLYMFYGRLRQVNFLNFLPAVVPMVIYFLLRHHIVFKIILLILFYAEVLANFYRYQTTEFYRFQTGGWWFLIMLFSAYVMPVYLAARGLVWLADRWRANRRRVHPTES
ncbi:hypothetical protein LJR009_005198 [Bosea sp. LjRoot9]|uniref:hypothetical protein n=1 Tax=Bosea sp. LjRoot9 TaxID=3342341 RepID=UPI003ECF01C9